MEEIWRAAIGYEGRLEVSSLGAVRTLPSVRASTRNGIANLQRKAGVVLSPYLLNNGYLVVAPKFGAVRQKLCVHRLVAMAFVPGHFDGATVNHMDGNKANNCVDNLEWLTLAENTAHQWAIGLVDIRGEKHPNSKLSDADADTIRNSSGDVRALARQFGVSTSLIYKIRQGRKRQAIW